MKYTLIILLTTLFFPFSLAQSSSKKNDLNFFSADNINIQYTGRIDFSNPKKPKFWNPGVYVKAKFIGTSCEIVVNDEVLLGKSHNYLEIAIDGAMPLRIQTTGKSNIIKKVEGLAKGEHTITICKNTESSIGYVEFVGLNCEELLPLPPKPLRKIEFIGNSITCGTGSDISVVPCDQGEWYDQHNAYFSYGPLTARALDAQWHLTSVSGIGLMHSCCNMKVTMPMVFDKLNLSSDSLKWNFNLYQPDVVTVALGQNDGIQDSIIFCKAYVDFIKNVRTVYPHAYIIGITSPMANAALVKVMKNYLTGIVNYVNQAGDKKVKKFFFSRSFNSGCGGHPDLKEHQLISAELTTYIKETLKW